MTELKITDKTPKVYLSRRNLLALLSKLDRDADGGKTVCSIVKRQQAIPDYRQSMKTVVVIAVEDEDYYSSQNRPAGVMHPEDEINLTEPKSGVIWGGPLL